MKQFFIDFLATPIPVQFVVAFTLLFFFFAFVMFIRATAKKWKARGGWWKVPAWILVIVFGPLFIISDAGVNIVYMPLIYWRLANHYNEGWLLTNRLRYHKRRPGYNRQKAISLFICDRFVEKIDPGHCG